MEVLVDGVVVGTYSADGTFLTTPSWNNETITFTGNGSAVRIEFREAGVDTENGRGMFLDDIELTQTITSLQEQTISTEEDSALTISVLSNDSDVDGDSLSITEIQGQDVSAGQIVNITVAGVVVGTAQVVNGEIVFTPDTSLQSMNNGDFQAVNFDYSISDGQGGVDTATVSLNIEGVSDAFSLNVDIASQAADGSFNITSNSPIYIDRNGINTRSTYSESESQMTALPDGSYVVVYAGEDNAYENTSIFVQKFNADGTAEGSRTMLTGTHSYNAYDELHLRLSLLVMVLMRLHLLVTFLLVVLQQLLQSLCKNLMQMEHSKVLKYNFLVVLLQMICR